MEETIDNCEILRIVDGLTIVNQITTINFDMCTPHTIYQLPSIGDGSGVEIFKYYQSKKNIFV